MNELLLQAVIYLGAGVIAVPIAHRLGLGSVLGYLMAGIAIDKAKIQTAISRGIVPSVACCTNNAACDSRLAE